MSSHKDLVIKDSGSFQAAVRSLAIFHLGDIGCSLGTCGKTSVTEDRENGLSGVKVR